MKLLVIEDTKYMRTLLQDFLESAGYRDVLTAATAEEAFQVLGISDGRLDKLPLDVGCILMDIAMPGIDGIEACRKIKAFDCYKHVPVIMVTASREISHLTEAFKAGAIDYIRKPVSDIELQARVNTVLNLKSEIDERREKEENLKRLTDQLKESNVALEKLSFRDALTGLSNRFHLEQQIFTEWRRALRYRNALSLAIIEVDSIHKAVIEIENLAVSFDRKDLADEDIRLKKIAKQLKSKLKRPADLIARISENQFAILMPDTDHEGAVTVAEKLRKSVEMLKIEYSKNMSGKYTTLTCGVSTLVPTKKLGPPLLFDKAEKALKEAKKRGRNRTVGIKNEREKK